MRKLTDAEARPIMLTAGLTPLELYRSANRPWICKHEKCGRVVSPSYSDIKRRGGGGCPVCAKNMVDLEIVMATMASAELTPLEPFPGSKRPWRCEHVCGMTVSPTWYSIKQGQSGCKFCAHRVVDMDQVLATMALAELTPLESFPGVDKPWSCLHKCGRIVTPRYSNVQQGGGGCRSCLTNKPGCIYLIELTDHQNFPHGVLKIGRTGSRTRRLYRWQKRGWSVLEVFHFDDGKVPVTIEADVLRWFNKDLGLKPCLSDADMGNMHAASETVSVADLAAAGVSVADVRKKVKHLVKKHSAQPVAKAAA